MEDGFNKLKEGIFIEHRFNDDDKAQLLKYRKSKKLTLTGLKLQNFEFLLDLKGLEDLRLYSCTVQNSSALCELKKLKSLFINGVKKANDNFSFLKDIISLEKLGIGHAPHFEVCPDLSNMENLRSLLLFKCKRLTDISNVAKIPQLERFSIVSTPQKPEDLEFIMHKPTIKFMSGGFGSKKLDDEFDNMLMKYGIQYG